MGDPMSSVSPSTKDLQVVVYGPPVWVQTCSSGSSYPETFVYPSLSEVLGPVQWLPLCQSLVVLLSYQQFIGLKR